MCGICGIIRKDKKIAKEEIQKINTSLQHRGPDGEGFFLHNNVAIGHRRLSIIDLETGKQPMTNEDESVWITFNGELYNYKEIRHILIEKGHIFKSRSDTEVVIHAWEEWKERCVEKFRGMFAFAIVDTNIKQIFIARDHLGIKPVYYYSSNNCFAFASEIQALKQVENVELTINIQALDQYLWLQYIPDPLSIFNEIMKLPPASWLKVDFNLKTIKIRKYWDFQFAPDYSKSEKQMLEELDAKLYDSVEKHLMSEVPYGAFLSGGIDSSLITGYMAQILPFSPKTFSIGFNEAQFDESKYAQQVAAYWKTQHYSSIVEVDALAILPELVKHYGEPFGDSSAIPTYYVCKEAAKHVTMILSGDGGDELFGGYASYENWLRFIETAPKNSDIRTHLYPIAHKIMPHSYPAGFKPEQQLHNWLKQIEYMPQNLRHNLWNDQYRGIIHKPITTFKNEFFKASKKHKLQIAQYADIKTYLPFDILKKVDIASMMHSLEVRTPLVDKEIVEFAASIPPEYNFTFENNKYNGKILLKKLLNRHFASEFVEREKQGFAFPLNIWLENNEKLKNYVSEKLLNNNAGVLKYFKKEKIESLIRNKASANIWLLLFLEEWFQQNNV